MFRVLIVSVTDFECQTRWALLAGFGFGGVSVTLTVLGETELGDAEEQPSEG